MVGTDRWAVRSWKTTILEPDGPAVRPYLFTA